MTSAVELMNAQTTPDLLNRAVCSKLREEQLPESRQRRVFQSAADSEFNYEGAPACSLKLLYE